MPKVNYTHWLHLLLRLEDNSNPLYLSLTPKFMPQGMFDRIRARIVYQNCPVEEQVYHIDLVDYVDMLQTLPIGTYRRTREARITW